MKVEQRSKGGSYREDQQSGGNDVILERRYRHKGRSRQRAIVTILGDVRASQTNTTLHVGLPERRLADTYAWPLAMFWEAVVAGTGAVLLLGIAISFVILRQVP